MGDDKGNCMLFHLGATRHGHGDHGGRRHSHIDVRPAVAVRSWHVCDGDGGLTCPHREPHKTNVAVTDLRGLHGDWITQMTYSPDLSCLITSSLDKTLCFVDAEAISAAALSQGEASDAKPLTRVRKVFRGHEKVVSSRTRSRDERSR